MWNIDIADASVVGIERSYIQGVFAFYRMFYMRRTKLCNLFVSQLIKCSLAHTLSNGYVTR